MTEVHAIFNPETSTREADLRLPQVVTDRLDVVQPVVLQFQYRHLDVHVVEKVHHSLEGPSGKILKAEVDGRAAVGEERLDVLLLFGLKRCKNPV
jgi:hypothetical protein